MMVFCMAWYTYVCGIHYPRNGSVCTILTLWYHMILCSALIITYHVEIKKQIDHGRPQRILLHFLIPDKRRYPYDRALMTSCLDPYGKEKPLSSPSQEIVDSDFGHLRILTVREEEPSHFWPCQLWSITPPIFVEFGRKWRACTAKRWVHCIFPFFMPNLHEISPFSCLLSQIGCKHATINFEREKELAKKGKSFGPITKNPAITLKQKRV